MSGDSSLRETLTQRLGRAVAFDVDLGGISRWQIGGPANAVVDAHSAEDVVDLVRIAQSFSVPLLVVGDMSNVLFDTDGFDGVILRLSRSMSKVKISETRVVAQAGVSVPALARMTADAGLSGLEHTVGIPGTLGGLVTMNGGSQRKGIGDCVEVVRYIDSAGAIREMSREECDFAYRSSAIQRLDAIVLEVELVLTPSSPASVHAEMDAVIESRKARFPEDLPNCGSTFLSDPRMYSIIGAPGKAIEDAGLKGLTRGRASISHLHANFVVNLGGATSDDVLTVIRDVRDEVRDRTGFEMDCEVRYVSPSGDIVPAHEAAENLTAGRRDERLRS